jgi:outer membrane protein OmpA-like peptidoglycan-associated protein
MEPYRLRIIPRRWTSRLATSVVALAFIVVFFSARNSCAQSGGASSDTTKVTWPHTLTLGFGAAGNDAWNGGSQYSPVDSGYIWTKSHMIISPEFHLLAEIPIGNNLMFAPRIAYNGYNMQYSDASTKPAGITTTKPLTLSVADLGADLLLKYSLNNLHFMGGFNLGVPLFENYTYTSTTTADTAIPNKAGFVLAVKVGIGYDIPLNDNNTIWLTPELFATYSLTGYQSNLSSGMSLIPIIFTGGASLKFALPGSTPPPPPSVPISATISAHGVMPDGSPAPNLVSPQQAIHNRSSVPLLPYIFFDEGSAVIPARYSQSGGATGFSEQSALEGKDALQANHEVMDVLGSRMKNNPSMKVRLTGTNSNSKDEKNNIELSKARATAVADYLENTWGISPSRITIDQRNLPEIPTNPVTKAGMAENRRVEITSTNDDLTAPVKIENRQNLSVGATTVRFDIKLSPDPSMHHYKSWTITIDKDSLPIAPSLSGTGAPPTTTTQDIPNAQQYMDQPIQYTLAVTDSNGQVTRVDGFTKIEAKTVDRNNFEKYAMLSFDFDKADINPRARQMLDLIGESISGGATGVKIDGYCDSTGTAEYNQTLSEARANGAITALRSMTSLPANVRAQGHGINDPKFPNDLPEGRQLNRRVEFTIQKSGQ